MIARLPETAAHGAVLCAAAALSVADMGKERWLLVAPPQMRLPASCKPDARIHPDDATVATYDLIIAFDLWSDASDPVASLIRLQAALRPDGRLILVQTNLPQRQGFIPPQAGGPPRSPDYYAFRSALHDVWPTATLGLVMLDGSLQLHPVGAAGTALPAGLHPLQAVAFIAASVPLQSASASAPEDVPHQASDLAEVSPAIARGARRKLAFVIDVPDWAYANIVNHIAPHLAGRYDVTRFYISDYESRAELLTQLFVENQFDNIHFMWRELWFNTVRSPSLLRQVQKRTGLAADALARRIAAPVISTTIYDHLFLTPDEVAERRLPLALTDGYSTASKLLAGIYAKTFNRAPDTTTPDGVNTAFFANTPPEPTSAGGLRVGWVGNSSWGTGNAGVGDDPKGLHTILKPAIDALQAEGREVLLVLADRNLRQRNREEMRDYYRDEIDVLVCASAYEGTPNPVLEAAASGRAWISTDVGIVREVAGPMQQRLILAERSADCMAAALRAFIDQPELRAAAEAENHERAALIDWRNRVSDWTRLFAAAEAQHSRGTGILRHEVLATQLGQMEALRKPQGHRPNSLVTASAKTPISNPAFTPGAISLAAEARIEGLEEWLGEALEEIKRRDTWTDQLQKRIGELERWTDALQDHIAVLEASHASLAKRLARALRRRLSRIVSKPVPDQVSARPDLLQDKPHNE